VTDPEFHSEPPSTSIADKGDPSPPMQTFVFSATLSKELQQNLKKRWRHRGIQKNNSSSTLDDLLSRLDFRDAEPEINDLSPKGGVVPTLKESRIECLATDKVRVLYPTCPFSESPSAGCLSLLLSTTIPRAHACVHVINRRDSQIGASSRATRSTHVPTSLPARATPAPQESRSVRAQTLPRV
jgi:hypothetical protein